MRYTRSSTVESSCQRRYGSFVERKPVRSATASSSAADPTTRRVDPRGATPRSSAWCSEGQCRSQEDAMTIRPPDELVAEMLAVIDADPHHAIVLDIAIPADAADELIDQLEAAFNRAY